MDKTRYQILHLNSSKIENFTAKQASKLKQRVKVLNAKGVKFTVWDTQRNGLSALFRWTA